MLFRFRQKPNRLAVAVVSVIQFLTIIIQKIRTNKKITECVIHFKFVALAF